MPLEDGAGSDDIAAFAAQYVAAITEIQPHGPYVLVGYSLGGLIVYEAARILRSKGEQIALLALLDSYPHHRFWPMRAWLGLLAERSWHHLRPARRPGLREILPHAASRLCRLVRDLAARCWQTDQPLATDRDAAPSATLRQIRRGFLTALARYRGERYDGKVVFFSPETRWLRKTPKDPRSVWRRLVGEIEVVTVPGNHHTMCSTHAGTLAAALNRRIGGALCRIASSPQRRRAQLRNLPDPMQLVADEPADFRVHTRAYTDRGIFDIEMDRIFGGAWVYLAHDSELPAPGDYKTTYIGRQPVIVSRDDAGRLHVLFNRCRHRASLVCREERGHCRHFQCPYHGWLYGNDGRLVAIPQRASGYAEHFDQERLGLLAPARVESYRGLIFANLSDTGPSLREHLGRARHYIDLQLDRAPAGEIVLPYPPHRLTYEGNWKFQVENATDAYHVNYVHESFQLLLERFASDSGQHGNHLPGPENRTYWERLGTTRGFPGGHGLLEAAVAPEFIEQQRHGSWASYIDALETLHGRARMLEIMGQYHLVIYPNLALLHGQLRVIRPIAVDRTEILVYPYALNGISEAQEAERLRGYERFFGPASFGQPDDVEIFALNQAGLQASAVDWLVMSRGLHDERGGEHGERIGRGTSETPIRAAFREWRALMAGERDLPPC